MVEFANIFEVKDVAAAKHVAQTQGIIGVGVTNPQPKITVYVDSPSAARRVPEYWGGYKTTVRVTDPPVALSRLQYADEEWDAWSPPVGEARKTRQLSLQPLAEAIRTQRVRPAPPGVSIGSINVTAGTYGIAVYDGRTGEKLGLSNNHVLADVNNDAIGTPIVQQGTFDGGTLASNRIGQLLRYVRLDPTSSSNRVDAAVFRPDSPADLTDEIIGLVRPTGWKPAQIGMDVIKSGRTSGITASRVTDVSGVFAVNYRESGVITLRECIVTETAIAQGGDSGSAVLQSGTSDVVGLLFAGSTELSLCSKIEHVMAMLNISVTPGGQIPGTTQSSNRALYAVLASAAVASVVGISLTSAGSKKRKRSHK